MHLAKRFPNLATLAFAGATLLNSCGSNAGSARSSLTPCIPLIPFSTSPNIGCHQGIAANHEDILTIDTARICRYNSNWELQAENDTVLYNTQLNHLGDGDCSDGILYIACENWQNGVSQPTHPSILLVDCVTLTIVSKMDVSDFMTEISGVAINPSNHHIYAISYIDGNHVWEFDVARGSLVQVIPLSKTIPEIQGIAIQSDTMYLATTPGRLYTFSMDGIYMKEYRHAVPGVHEGLNIFNNELEWLVDDGISSRKVYSFQLPGAGTQ